MLAQAQERASEFLFNVTIKESKSIHGDLINTSVIKELTGILEKDSWLPVKLSKHDLIQIKDHLISSRLFLKKKFKSDWTFDRLKARLVAG